MFHSVNKREGVRQRILVLQVVWIDKQFYGVATQLQYERMWGTGNSCITLRASGSSYSPIQAAAIFFVLDSSGVSCISTETNCSDYGMSGWTISGPAWMAIKSRNSCFNYVWSLPALMFHCRCSLNGLACHLRSLHGQRTPHSVSAALQSALALGASSQKRRGCYRRYPRHYWGSSKGAWSKRAVLKCLVQEVQHLHLRARVELVQTRACVTPAMLALTNVELYWDVKSEKARKGKNKLSHISELVNQIFLVASSPALHHNTAWPSDIWR